MLKILVWVVGGILALDVVVISVFMAWAILLQRRHPPIEVEQLRAAQRRDSIHIVGPSDAATSQIRGRRMAGRLAMVALVATILCAGTVLVSPRARHVVAGAFGAVTGGLGSTAGAQEPGAAPTAGPDVSSDAGKVSSPGSVRTPADDPRGPGGVGAPAGDHTSPGGVHDVFLKPDSPPALRAASVSATQIDLTWTDVGNETGYRVERWTDGGAGWTPIATTGQDITTYSDAGLTPGTTYGYRIFATNGEGDSPSSGTASATTTVDPASPPTLIAGSVSSSEIDLTWTDVGNETGYRVERSPDGIGGWDTIATPGQDMTDFSDTDVAPGTTYFYRVFATNAGGDSPPSDVASATTATTTGTDPSDSVPTP